MAALGGAAGPQARFTPDPFTVRLGVTVVAEAGPWLETVMVTVADCPPFSQLVPVVKLAACGRHGDACNLPGGWVQDQSSRQNTRQETPVAGSANAADRLEGRTVWIADHRYREFHRGERQGGGGLSLAGVGS